MEYVLVKATGNLRRYHKTHVQRRKKIIIDELLKLSREKVQFKDITGLAKRLSEMVALREERELLERKIEKRNPPISYTTLIRNDSKYRHLLISYITGGHALLEYLSEKGTIDGFKHKPSKCVGDPKTLMINNPSLKAFVTEKELELQDIKSELSDARDEIRRLKSYIQNQSTNKHQRKRLSLDRGQSNAVEDIEKITTALMQIVDSTGFLRIDLENEVIIDGSSIFNNSVVDKDLLTPFFKIIRQNKTLIQLLMDTD